MANNHFIYKYECPDGSIYIGQTYHGSNRYGNKSEYKGCHKVYNKMKHYPVYDKCILIDNLSAEEANYFEILYISEYNSLSSYTNEKGLNLTPGVGNVSCSAKKTQFKKGESPWNKGKHFSEEAKRNMSEARKNSPYGKKKVIAINLNTNEKYNFKSINECARALNSDGSTITKICKGKLHKLHGYTFMYGGD